MPKRVLITALLLIAALMGFVTAVVAAPTKFSGALEWRYGSYTARENGNKVLNASHFTQKYSFLAEKDGLLANGRLGKYDLALGYEWTWVDFKDRSGAKVDVDNPLDKLLYRGEIQLAPGGLPFNLRAFSYDLRSTYFIEQELGEIFTRRGFPVPGDSVTNVQNGINRVTGITLNAGVRNGHYEGKYRDVLSTVPRLLIDYRQNDVRDLKSLTPRDFTDRNLAFVSLNKKDNWFHYKIFTHQDRVDPAAGYSEQAFLLGSIDQLDRRQWINLTNWIQVSTDVSYSETVPKSAASNQVSQKRYDINLFTKAKRTRWRGSNFTTFSRINDGNSLDRNLYVPFFASGELNRDTSWRVSLVESSRDSNLFGPGVDLQTDDFYATAKVDTFRQARYIFSPTIAAESKRGNDGEGYSVRAGAEFRNNSNYRSIYDVFGRYELRWFQGTGRADFAVDYLEQIVEGRLEKDINSQLRAGLKQNLLLASGRFDATVSDNIIADSDVIINHTAGDDGSVFRSLTAIYADYRGLNRMNNRVELSFDYQSSPDLSGSQMKLTHALDYRKGAWSVFMDNSLGFGDELATTALSLNSGVENFITNTTRLLYRPSRVVKANLETSYDRRGFSNNSVIETYRVRELAEYTLWKVNGLIRRLASFGQEIELLKSQQDSVSIGDNYSAFTLFANYYPTRISLLTAKLRYERDGIDQNDILIGYLTAGLNYRKLKVSLDYSYGERTAGTTAPERTEHRWELKVTKLF